MTRSPVGSRYYDGMRHVVYATAGHIDHGKTALVKSLTGTDCDRLPEEKDRGITVDLGFARLEEGGFELHFVDVPGHERLVHNMVAGAAGVDLALLVVAADEGIMPQTREHLEVIRLMGVSGGAVALTKIDRVDDEIAELAVEELKELLAETPFATSPVVPVSAVTGQGVPQLRKVLVEQAVNARPRMIEGRPYRQTVDRVFTLHGVGTVITGTSLWGRLTVGDPVKLIPGGRETRARRLHVHGEERRVVEAGERVAVNLAGLKKGDVHRGDQLMSSGDWESTRRLAARLELLSATPTEIDEGGDLMLHAFGAQVGARIERLASRPAKPGTRVEAVLRLDAPLLLFPGDRGVLRRPSPVNTLGGLVVLDPHHPPLRRKASRELTHLPLPTADQRPDLVQRWIVRAGLRGVTQHALASRLGLDDEAIEAPLGRLLSDGSVIVLGKTPPVLGDASTVAELADAAAAELERRLEGELASSGIPANDFSAAILPRNARSLADLYLERLRQQGVIELVRGRVVPAGRENHITEEGQELARRVETVYRKAGTSPPSPAEVAGQLDAKPATIEGICRFLVERGVLARLEGRLLIHKAVLEEIRDSVQRWGVSEFGVGDFKERFGVTRKLAIPLLGWLDSERVTVREGSRRKLLARE